MRKFFTLFSIATLLSVSPSLVANSDDYIDIGEGIYDATAEIPLMEPLWERVRDVAQYGRANWDNVIGRVHHVSACEAKMIAARDPNITYFFYVKGRRMVLINQSTVWRVFYRGDAVFFTGESWWGSAEGLADGYIRCAS